MRISIQIIQSIRILKNLLYHFAVEERFEIHDDRRKL